ncbi:MAG: DnaJ domain-containing protein [Alphaproteobacteria bacterium]|nr:DnaJ domain-containing protein [Alphaproteobacteria bacterium]
MSWLVLGVSLVIGGILLLRWFTGADPKTVLRVLRWTGVGFALILAFFLIISGRFAWLWVALMGLLPWISRFRMLRNLMRAARGPSQGRQSRVDTRFVAMTLDHDSGDMDGEVLEGPFAGRFLSDMTLDELLELLSAAGAVDGQSAGVLQAYLDRAHGDAWRERAQAGGNPHAAADPQGRMTVEEAYRILGLEPGVPESEVRRSHRDLMKKLHPDHGGSDYLAAKINEAKETLLGDVN